MQVQVVVMPFTDKQIQQLLRPINRNRVLKDGKGHSHVSQQDVVAHLIRVFGFGGFDVTIDGPHLIFEAERIDLKTGEAKGRWDVCYRCNCRLTIKDIHGNEVCHFEDGSTATAQNQTRGDGHDLAYKSAISLSKKRAAINMGDQFGLSLYNKGQLEALVKGLIVKPAGEDDGHADVQDGVSKQVALGNDEIDRDMDGGPQRTPNGGMTAAQKAAHTALERDVLSGGKAERLSRPAAEGDEWSTS